MISLTTILEEAFILGFDLLPDKKHLESGLNSDKLFVFVHGYSGTFSGTEVLKRNYARSINTPLLLFDYSSRQSIEQISEQLQRFLRQHGDRPYYLVGHSLGGIVVRYFNDFVKDKEHVERAALIATPNRGTKAAYLRFRESGRQVRPHSEFLASLDLKPLSVPYINILAQGDEFIIPNHNAILDGAWNVIIKDRMHFTILNDQRTYYFIKEFFECKDPNQLPKNRVLL